MGKYVFAGALALALVVLASAAVSAQDDQPTDTSSGTMPTDAVQAGVPTTLDPCQLVTSSEASSLAGVTFQAGQETDNDGGGKTCVYGSQTTNVFMVTVAQASDAATAQADWAQEESSAQDLMQKNVPPGVSVSVTIADVSSLAGADRAAAVQGNGSLAGRTISSSGYYLLKGATFVAFSDMLLGPAGPSNDALQSEAHTVLARLP